MEQDGIAWAVRYAVALVYEEIILRRGFDPVTAVDKQVCKVADMYKLARLVSNQRWHTSLATSSPPTNQAIQSTTNQAMQSTTRSNRPCLGAAGQY